MKVQRVQINQWTPQAITIFLLFQQQQRPDLSRLMQLQAAGAGLPPNAGALMAGIPPGLFQNGPPGSQALPGGNFGIPPSLLAAGIPPTSVAALAAAAAHYGGGIRPPLGSIDHHVRKETETPLHKPGKIYFPLFSKILCSYCWRMS